MLTKPTPFALLAFLAACLLACGKEDRKAEASDEAANALRVRQDSLSGWLAGLEKSLK